MSGMDQSGGQAQPQQAQQQGAHGGNSQLNPQDQVCNVNCACIFLPVAFIDHHIWFQAQLAMFDNIPNPNSGIKAFT
jgi:hypothetical protein